MAKIIKLTPKQITKHPFVTKDGKQSFYNLIEELCKEPDKEVISMDCTKINVAQNIQKSWYEYAEEHNIDKSSLTMTLLFAGPKAQEHLADNTVEILDGFFTYKEN